MQQLKSGEGMGIGMLRDVGMWRGGFMNLLSWRPPPTTETNLPFPLACLAPSRDPEGETLSTKWVKSRRGGAILDSRFCHRPGTNAPR